MKDKDGGEGDGGREGWGAGRASALVPCLPLGAMLSNRVTWPVKCHCTLREWAAPSHTPGVIGREGERGGGRGKRGGGREGEEEILL